MAGHAGRIIDILDRLPFRFGAFPLSNSATEDVKQPTQAMDGDYGK